MRFFLLTTILLLVSLFQVVRRFASHSPPIPGKEYNETRDLIAITEPHGHVGE